MTQDESRRILIVDDDAQIRKLLRVILVREGYAVMEAPDGQAALRTFRRQPPALVITDLIMPVKEGIETIVDLRKADRKVKIIAISGGGKLDPHTYLDIARGLGADAAMIKPIDTAKLIATVNALLS
jgi:DNA-binding response OmpR family regulator